MKKKTINFVPILLMLNSIATWHRYYVGDLLVIKINTSSPLLEIVGFIFIHVTVTVFTIWSWINIGFFHVIGDWISWLFHVNEGFDCTGSTSEGLVYTSEYVYEPENGPNNQFIAADKSEKDLDDKEAAKKTSNTSFFCIIAVAGALTVAVIFSLFRD